MKRTIKHIICGAALLAGALSGVSCSEWTENEKIAVKDPVFGESNPELYARYVAELRAWKQSEHQRTIVWFDNSNKQPASRGGFFSDVPDSVDIVALKASGRLTASELEQVASLHEKGTRVIGAFDCTALLASGEEGDGAGESAEGTSDAATRLRTALETRMAEVEADALDGFTLRYEPTDITFATDEERTAQLALDAVVAEALKGWRQRHPEALLLFEGTPQYFSDVEAAALCDYLVVRCLDAESVYDFGMRARRTPRLDRHDGLSARRVGCLGARAGRSGRVDAPSRGVRQGRRGHHGRAVRLLQLDDDLSLHEGGHRDAQPLP